MSGRRRSKTTLPESTATFQVQFSPRPQAVPPIAPIEPTGRLPRVTRLLALAHRIDGMIRAREVRDWAEAARLVGVTRARMTQIANLLLLAPDIQLAILAHEPVAGSRQSINEHELRKVLRHAVWVEQRRMRY